MGPSGELWDHRWRIVHTSTENRSVPGIDAEHVDPYYGLTPIARARAAPDLHRATDESGAHWVAALGPSMRHDIAPTDTDFADAFADVPEFAAATEPAEAPPQDTVLERVDAVAAVELGIDTGLSYQAVRDLEASTRADRDAANIAVAQRPPPGGATGLGVGHLHCNSSPTKHTRDSRVR